MTLKKNKKKKKDEEKTRLEKLWMKHRIQLESSNIDEIEDEEEKLKE